MKLAHIFVEPRVFLRTKLPNAMLKKSSWDTLCSRFKPWRMLPDLTFRGSTDGTVPSLTMQLLPLKNSGSGYNVPKSVGGTSADATQAVTATQSYPIDLDTYIGQINIRIRGRQMAMRIASNQLGTQWQLGSPRLDLRADGRR